MSQRARMFDCSLALLGYSDYTTCTRIPIVHQYTSNEHKHTIHTKPFGINICWNFVVCYWFGSMSVTLSSSCCFFYIICRRNNWKISATEKGKQIDTSSATIFRWWSEENKTQNKRWIVSVICFYYWCVCVRVEHSCLIVPLCTVNYTVPPWYARCTFRSR